MISIIFRDKTDSNLDYKVQSAAIRKFGILIGYTYDILALINQISNSHQARQNKFNENRMIVAQVIRIWTFKLLQSDKSDKIRQLW